MFKKLFNLINKKKTVETKVEVESKGEEINVLDVISVTKTDDIENETKPELIKENNSDSINDCTNNLQTINISSEELINQNKILKENKEYIKDIKISRERGIKAIDIYTQEVLKFNTYKECSRKLNVPLSYIKENLKYGYTDYMGAAINYIKESLGENVKDECAYLNSSKNPIDMYNYLNNKIFTSKISEKRREEILSSEKIDPIKMHYRFECTDEEYDDYFKKYGAIIKRGGNKKIELVNQKGEVVQVFKSLINCCNYLNKDKDEISYRLKCGNTKIGRYEIRYSLRNI